MRAQLDSLLAQATASAISELGNPVLPVLSIQSQQWLSEMKKSTIPASHTFLQLNAFALVWPAPRELTSATCNYTVSKHPARIPQVPQALGLKVVSSYPPSLLALRCLSNLGLHHFITQGVQSVLLTPDFAQQMQHLAVMCVACQVTKQLQQVLASGSKRDVVHWEPMPSKQSICMDFWVASCYYEHIPLVSISSSFRESRGWSANAVRHSAGMGWQANHVTGQDTIQSIVRHSSREQLGGRHKV